MPMKRRLYGNLSKMIERSSGILLHPTSLPGPQGIGDLGQHAYDWVDFLAKGGFSWWQFLPIGTTGFGHSPYQSFSSFAGNPLLISLEKLVDDGLLDTNEIIPEKKYANDQVDYSKVIAFKEPLLIKAAKKLQNRDQYPASLEKFWQENKEWISEFALFMALKQKYGNQAWVNWPRVLRDRHPEAIKKAKDDLSEEIRVHTNIQLLFGEQWQKLRNYAQEKGIGLIGDLPIYVAHDSVDVWSNRKLFQINEDGDLTAQAGVPPDYFTETGQLWGNPLYTWDQHARDNYAWWGKRLSQALAAFDLIRLDHFRGFAGYYSVPADHKTARHGEWIEGPGIPFFEAMKSESENFSIIAEDLGEITPDVIELRDQFNFPSMKILQFAFFEGKDHEFLPHNYPQNAVAYTSTHDNETSRSWFENSDRKVREFALSYLDATENSIVDKMIAAVFNSAASLAIIPMQDLLNLDNKARMNSPGSLQGNWRWRMPANYMDNSMVEKINNLNLTSRR